MIDITRRGLLQSIFAGSLLAMSSGLVAKLPDRYRELIDAQKEAIRLTKSYHEIRERGDFAKNFSAREDLMKDIGLVAAVDHVLQVLLDRFDNQPVDTLAARAQVKALLSGDLKIDTLDERDLRNCEDYIVNIATARTLLQRDMVPINALLNKPWVPWVIRFRDLIAYA